jgi:hypothetical protein
VAIVKRRLSLEISVQASANFEHYPFEKMPISTTVFDVGSQFDDIDSGQRIGSIRLMTGHYEVRRLADRVTGLEVEDWSVMRSKYTSMFPLVAAAARCYADAHMRPLAI